MLLHDTSSPSKGTSHQKIQLGAGQGWSEEQMIKVQAQELKQWIKCSLALAHQSHSRKKLQGMCTWGKGGTRS